MNDYRTNPNPNELLAENQDFPRLFDENMRVKLIQTINDLCIAVNRKESSFYSNETTITGAQALPSYRPALQGDSNIYFRTVRRKVVYTDELPNATSKSVAHDIDFPKGSVGFRLWGCASALSSEELQEFVEMPSNQVRLKIDKTNLTITTMDDMSRFNSSFVVVEYAVLPES